MTQEQGLFIPTSVLNEAINKGVDLSGLVSCFQGAGQEIPFALYGVLSQAKKFDEEKEVKRLDLEAEAKNRRLAKKDSDVLLKQLRESRKDISFPFNTNHYKERLVIQSTNVTFFVYQVEHTVYLVDCGTLATYAMDRLNYSYVRGEGFLPELVSLEFGKEAQLKMLAVYGITLLE